MGGVSFETLALAKKYTDQKQFGDSGADLGVTGASVGQIIQVAAVDAEGTPIRWEPVDKPESGVDGKTPVKGTDYWTQADQTAIVNDVLAALPTWTGGAY